MIGCESVTNSLPFACKMIFLRKLEKHLVWFWEIKFYLENYFYWKKFAVRFLNVRQGVWQLGIFHLTEIQVAVTMLRSTDVLPCLIG